MHIWAIADLHLSFGVPNKEMDVFGKHWEKHHEKIRKNWDSMIKEDDLVLIAGDISWAMHPDDALKDLQWIHERPGTKVMIKGNHDLWWRSKSKVKKMLPPSIHIIQNDAFTFNGVTIAGTRLWENNDIDYTSYVEMQTIPENVRVHQKTGSSAEREQDEKIYKSELERLAWSLDAMDKEAPLRIVMVHYPPTGPDKEDTSVTRLLHNESIHYCLYGHLHNLKKEAPVDFTKQDIHYFCTACDYLNFIPLKLPVSVSKENQIVSMENTEK